MTRKTFTPTDYHITPKEGQAAVDAWCRANGHEPGDISLITWPDETDTVTIETAERDPETGLFVVVNEGTADAEVVHHCWHITDPTPFPWEQVVTVTAGRGA